MKRIVLTGVFSLVLSLSIISCDGNKLNVKNAPLKEDNGKSVYTTILSDKDRAHYDMDTGFLEGAHIDLGDKSQTVVRID